MPAMQRDAIERLCRCECAARAVRVVLSSPLALAKLCVAANAVSVEDMINLNIFSTNVVAFAADRKQRSLGSRIVLREPIAAHAPGGRHADATGTFHRQHALLKAGAAELASRLWDLPSGETGFGLLFTG
jgi:hypothetical protein